MKPETFGIEPLPNPTWGFFAFAAVMYLSALFFARRKKPYWGRIIIGSVSVVLGFLDIRGFLPVIILFGLVILASALDLLLDRTQPKVGRILVLVASLVAVSAFTGLGIRSFMRSKVALTITDKSLEQTWSGGGVQIDRSKARILEFGSSPRREWHVKDGVRNISLDENRTYLDVEGQRFSAEQVVKKLEAWVGKRREKVTAK